MKDCGDGRVGRAGRGDHVPAGLRHIMASATTLVKPDQ